MRAALFQILRHSCSDGRLCRSLPFLGAAAAIVAANSPLREYYQWFWQLRAGGASVGLWVNDCLMVLFFLQIGFELKRELCSGELAEPGYARLVLMAALGTVAVPAVVHFCVMEGRGTAASLGMAISTDMAFGVAVLALLGNRVPSSLRIYFIGTALAGNFLVVFASTLNFAPDILVLSLILAVEIYFALLLMDGLLRIAAPWPYLIGGGLIWLLSFKSGIHAAIAGTLLGFAIPYRPVEGKDSSPVSRVEKRLKCSVHCLILPAFMFGNTDVPLGLDLLSRMSSVQGIGIYLALVIGKPAGVALLPLVAARLGLCHVPPGLTWRHMVGAGILSGIGFTMSSYIANLSFTGAGNANDAAGAIVLASLTAGVLGYCWLSTVALPGDSRTPGRQW